MNYPKESPIAGLSGIGGGASGLVTVSAGATGYAHEFTYSTGGSWSGTFTGDNANYPKERIFNGGTNTSNYQDAGGSHRSDEWVKWTFDPIIGFSSQVKVYFDGDYRSGTPKVEAKIANFPWTQTVTKEVTGSGSLGNASWLTFDSTGFSQPGLWSIRVIGSDSGGYWGMLYAIEVDGEHLTSTGTHTW